MVGILGKQHRAGFGIDHESLRGLGLKKLRIGRNQRGEQKAKTQKPGKRVDKAKTHERLDPLACRKRAAKLSGFFPADQPRNGKAC